MNPTRTCISCLSILYMNFSLRLYGKSAANVEGVFFVKFSLD